MSASRKSTAMNSEAYQELGQLMEEFPDWKDTHPDVFNEMYPMRYTKNKQYAKTEQTFIKPRATTVPALSDYRDTYIEHRLRPRSTKRPPKTPRNPHPPPMALQSSMRAEYPDKFNQFQGRPPLMKQDDKYEAPAGKFDSLSAYQLDYPYKEPITMVKSTRQQDSNMLRQPGKFDSRTTNKEYYRQWKPQTTFTFGELPSFTDSILYPNQKRSLETTTKSTFKGVTTKKVDPVRATSPNIRIEGGREFDTINSLTYKKHDNVERCSPVVHQAELGKASKRKSKFESMTQSRRDFGSTYDRGVPKPPKPVEPPKASIDLKFDNKRSFVTEQRNQFLGIDVESNPIPQSYKPEFGEYKKPETKFETMTKHKLDYQPIDLEANQVERARPPEQKKDKNLPKFDGTTTSKQYFRKWDVQPRPHYGDVHEALQYVRSDQYVPHTSKFEGTTTTRDQYQPKKAEIREPFVPEQTKLDTSGVMDFGTVYRHEYNGPPVVKNIPKHQAALLLKELRRRKQGQESRPIQQGGMPVSKTQQRIPAK